MAQKGTQNGVEGTHFGVVFAQNKATALETKPNCRKTAEGRERANGLAIETRMPGDGVVGAGRTAVGS